MLDTSVVVHALGNDADTPAARHFLSRVEAGEVQVVVDPMVVNELIYVLSRFTREYSRARIAEAALSLLDTSEGAAMNVTLRRAIEVWRDTPGLSFVDAYLGSRAADEDRPVYTVNRKDFPRQGVDAPDLRELMGTG